MQHMIGKPVQLMITASSTYSCELSKPILRALGIRETPVLKNLLTSNMPCLPHSVNLEVAGAILEDRSWSTSFSFAVIIFVAAILESSQYTVPPKVVMARRHRQIGTNNRKHRLKLCNPSKHNHTALPQLASSNTCPKPPTSKRLRR